MTQNENKTSQNLSFPTHRRSKTMKISRKQRAMAYYMAERKYRHQQRLLAARLPVQNPSSPLVDAFGLEAFNRSLNLNEEPEPVFLNAEYVLNALAIYDDVIPQSPLPLLETIVPNTNEVLEVLLVGDGQTYSVTDVDHEETEGASNIGESSLELYLDWIDGPGGRTNRSRVVPHPLYGYNFKEVVHAGRCGRCECYLIQKI